MNDYSNIGNLYKNLGPRVIAATGARGFLPLQIFQPCYGKIYTKRLRVENVSTFFSFLTWLPNMSNIYVKMHMLHHILLKLGNHLLIQRFFERMKGDPSNICCTKNCFAIKFSAPANIMPLSITDCVSSLSLQKLSRFTFFSHSFFARSASENTNVGIQVRSIEFCIIYLRNWRYYYTVNYSKSYGSFHVKYMQQSVKLFFSFLKSGRWQV